ncbi:hypothetical protein F4802DRAFT_514642 [Xylaria palmicola]|nr:hypothetical protein F4802DRAFT_514642 [Xylaria palmicola]
MGDRITLQVGEQQFITTRDTLVGKSSYFDALLPDHSDRPKQKGSNDIFIDSDPVLFREILRYLRSGNFPLFFDTGSRTYNYGLYTALLGEARYFGIPKLESWIQNQRFLDAVKIQYSTDIIEDDDSGECLKGHFSTVRADQQLDISYLSRTEDVYLCPRRILVHRGQPDKCGRQCLNARGVSEREYEKTQLITAVVVKTQCLFNPDICLGPDAELQENAEQSDGA